MDIRQLMDCSHRPNITQRELYRVILRSCCNATGEMILTNQNTKLGQKIHYETNQKLFKTVDKKLHSMLPNALPWSKGLLGRCAVVGSGGILQNSSSYGNASLLLSPFSYQFCTGLSLDVYHVLRPLRPNQKVVFFNPNFLLQLSRKWKGRGLKEPRLTSGLMLASVHLYGFWPFPLDLYHNPLPHHYYDNVGPKKGVHSMPDEFLLMLQLHTQGVLQLHLGRC
ncbi:unnamed protein product [Coregonus sp. 'balchen']|nr:unnamed protein product [Coregonus sp. 'balchen']